MAHNMYEVGTRAWQPDQTEGWIASEVEEKIVQGDKVKLVFRLANGEVCALFDALWRNARRINADTDDLT
jgi:myosin heavy subunit